MAPVNESSREAEPAAPRRRPLSTPMLLRSYLLLGSLVLAGVALFFTNRVVRRLEEQSSTLSLVMARLLAASTAQVATTEDARFLASLGDIAAPITFAFIITDLDGRPQAWNSQTGLDPSSVADEVVQNADLAHPPEEVAYLLRKVREYERRNERIAMIRPSDDHVIGYFYYGPTGIEKEIRWVPWVLLGAAGMFAAIGITWYRSVRRSEQNLIWAGMAKETAHQLGTPISSLMGWMELMRDQAVKEGERTSVETGLFDEVEKEVFQDIERLKKVASRFGHIGSLPSLTQQDVVPIVAMTVGYYRRRLPQQGLKIQIVEDFEEDVPPVNVNAELMGWVVENLVKNAIDACDSKAGRIEVSVRRNPESETVELSVRDNGRGIAPADQKRIFDPGFTTRKRGWGLGLTLARRIIEEYHGGRLELRASAPGEGSEFVALFPV